MKLKFSGNNLNVYLTNAKGELSGNNLNVYLTNAKGEPIYTYQADALSVELDVAKLIESIDEIQQTFIDGLEKAFAEPTPAPSDETE